MVYYNPWFKGRKFRNYFLLFMSMVFYAYGEPLFVGIMILEIVIGWLLGKKIELMQQQKKKKRWLYVGVFFFVAMLFVFKYLTFFNTQFSVFFSVSTPDIDIALPIGISFFTFQLLSYIFDVYYGKAKAQSNILNVGLYITLFPQLIAGPIVRYDVIEKQILQRQENLQNFADGMFRFIYGLGKKVLIANYMAMVADNIFSAGAPEAIATAWLGAIAYTLQIYFDFSGYSDMAIGLSKMFGFSIPENFKYPYIANSVTDFWRRWHISLSSFLKDYIYIPLGGSRCSNSRYIFNLFVVWFLTGFWHGADYNFILWGLYFGLVLIIEKFVFKGFFDRHRVIGFVYTALIVNISFVIFNHSNLLDIKNFIVGLFNFKYLVDKETLFYLKNYVVFFAVCIVGITPLCKNIYSRLKNKDLLNIVLVVLLLIVSTAYIIDATFMPFLYFRF